MRTTDKGRRFGGGRAVGTLVAGGLLLSSSLPPAYADQGAARGSAGSAVLATSSMRFVYGAPQISDSGDRITWSWTLKNTGTVPVSTVVVTHYLSPSLPILYLSDKCMANAVKTVVKCAYGAMPVGKQLAGSIDVGLPADFSGNVQISGKVTWMYSGAVRTTATTRGAQS